MVIGSVSILDPESCSQLDKDLEAYYSKRKMVVLRPPMLLEDNSGSLELVYSSAGKVPCRVLNPDSGVDEFRFCGDLFTGMVVGVCGEIIEERLVIHRILFPGPAPIFSAPLLYSPTRQRNLILLISGIYVSDKESPERELLIEWINMLCGTTQDQEMASSVSKLIIAGGCIDPMAIQGDFGDGYVKSLRNFEIFLSRLGVSLHVDIMPGQADPTLSAVPQPPLKL
ncbi:hypothetical protein Pelo_11932 [Pelomyxa schiedti]|nr:hypothetical protein Pelo_11932 [Pelomyxa schiedti]